MNIEKLLECQVATDIFLKMNTMRNCLQHLRMFVEEHGSPSNQMCLALAKANITYLAVSLQEIADSVAQNLDGCPRPFLDKILCEMNMQPRREQVLVTMEVEQKSSLTTNQTQSRSQPPASSQPQTSSQPRTQSHTQNKPSLQPQPQPIEIIETKSPTRFTKRTQRKGKLEKTPDKQTLDKETTDNKVKHVPMVKETKETSNSKNSFGSQTPNMRVLRSSRK